VKNFSEATLQDLEEDPAAYGLPTFAQFCRNPGRWRKRRDNAFVVVDNGPSGSIKYYITKTRYFVESNGKTYECDTVEKSQQVLLSEGLNMDSPAMEWRSELKPQTSYKAEVHVTFRRKCLIALK